MFINGEKKKIFLLTSKLVEKQIEDRIEKVENSSVIQLARKKKFNGEQ